MDLNKFFTSFCPLDHTNGYQDCGCGPINPVQASLTPVDANGYEHSVPDGNSVLELQPSYSPYAHFYPPYSMPAQTQFYPVTHPYSVPPPSLSPTAEFDEILASYYRRESPTNQVVPQPPLLKEEHSNSSFSSGFSTPSAEIHAMIESQILTYQTALREDKETSQQFQNHKIRNQVVPQPPLLDEEHSNSSFSSGVSTPSAEIDAMIEAQILAYQTAIRVDKKTSQQFQSHKIRMSTGSDGFPVYHYDQMTFPTVGLLQAYLEELGFAKIFICDVCGQVLKRPEHLARHKVTSHSSKRPFGCEVCGKSFKRREHLELHSVVHSSVKAFKCAECGKGFKRKDHVKKHEKTHDRKRKKLEKMKMVLNVDVGEVNLPIQIEVEKRFLL